MEIAILNESELSDAATIWDGYTYIINGEVTILQLPEGKKKMIVAEYKAINLSPMLSEDFVDLDPNQTTVPIPESAIKSIRNCDMKGRNLPLKRYA